MTAQGTIESLRTALAAERERAEKAEAALEAQSPIIASYIAEQSGEAKPISVLGDWLRLVAKERHRAEAAEASLAEAKRLLKRWVSWCDDWHAGKSHPSDDIAAARAFLGGKDNG